MTTDPAASERPASAEDDEDRLDATPEDHHESVPEKISRSIHSEDAPLEDQMAEAPFALVAFGYMGVAALVMLVVALVLMTL